RSEEAAYRIVQESMSNAVRHGHPHAIHVQIHQEYGDIHLTIEDDGDGFAASPNRDGMGLKGMEERVRALNGEFAVEHRVRGVRVRAILPGAGARKVKEMENA